MRKSILSLTIVAFALLNFSCAKKTEQDDLAKAQDCLDKVPQSNPTAADACLAYVQKYTSQQANILKCGIYMTSGGLVENKIVQAYKASKDTTIQNKEAAYMAILSLNLPDVATGYTKAVAADTYCQQTGLPGLKYISGIIVAGTYLNKTIAAITSTSGIDINNPTAINSAVNTMLASCAAPPPATPAPACTADLATLGTTVANLSTTYCDNQHAKDEVCTKINAAVSSAGGTATNVGQAVFCYLNNKTFNQATQQCNP
jgi:hypothetical protein